MAATNLYKLLSECLLRRAPCDVEQLQNKPLRVAEAVSACCAAEAGLVLLQANLAPCIG